MLRNIFAVDVEFQVVLASQVRNKFLIGVRLSPAQLVIEMDHRENDAKLMPQLQQQSQKRNRINPPRDRHTDAIPRP
jgi:hypothetical protein